jgi:hypothetical protein
MNSSSSEKKKNQSNINSQELCHLKEMIELFLQESFEVNQGPLCNLCSFSAMCLHQPHC